MFDFDAGKLLIIGVIALIVIGPKELPRVLRQVGQTVGKLRRMAAEFQGQFMDAMKEADIQSIREEVDKISRESVLNTHFDPARDIQAELTRSIDKPVVDAVPALASVPDAPTADFAIPAFDVQAVEAEAAGAMPAATGTLADAGAAPIAVVSPVTAEAALSTVATLEDLQASIAQQRAAAPKRKIILPKRRPMRRAPHDVSDRTSVGTARI